MKFLQFTAFLATSTLAVGAQSALSAQDVYVLYSSKTKSLMKKVVSSMPGTKVKAFNAMLLSVSDYSGKQKALAKFDCAKVVVILGVKAAGTLKTARFTRPVVLVNAPEARIGSKAHVMHMIDGSTKPPNGVKPVAATKVAEIKGGTDCVAVQGKLAMEAAIAKAYDVMTDR